MSGRMLTRATRLLLVATASILILFTLQACGSDGGDDVAGPEYTIEVRVAGTGTGTVTSLPPAIVCPGTCGPLDWTPGAHVQLVATPTPPSTFGGWTGSVTSTADTIEVVVSGHVVVTATFNI
jgi:hypothetical protein